VFLFAGTVEKERNALAHGIWGYSADIPDAVLWTPLDAHAHFLIQTYKRDAARTHTSDPHTDLKRAMFVYKTSDLLEIKSKIKQAQRYAFMLHLFLRDGDEEAYLQLCSAAPIQAAVLQIQSARSRL